MIAKHGIIQGYVLQGLRIPGKGMEVLQNLQKFRVHGYGSVTELTEVPGIAAQAHRTHRSYGYGIERLCPYPGYCGTGGQNSHKIQVRV